MQRKRILRFVPGSALRAEGFAFQVHLDKDLPEPLSEVFLKQTDLIDSANPAESFGKSWLRLFGVRRSLTARNSPNFHAKLQVRPLEGQHSDHYLNAIDSSSPNTEVRDFRLYNYELYEIVQGSIAFEPLDNVLGITKVDCVGVHPDSNQLGLDAASEWDPRRFPTGTAVSIQPSDLTKTPRWQNGNNLESLNGTFYVIGRDTKPELFNFHIQLAASEKLALQGMSIDLERSSTTEFVRFPIRIPWAFGLWSNNVNIKSIVLGASELHLEMDTARDPLHVRFHNEHHFEPSGRVLRFWEMLSCGRSDPVAHIDRTVTRLERLLESNPHLQIERQGQNRPQVVFKHSPLAISTVEEVLAPQLRLRFKSLAGRPRWTPQTLRISAGDYDFSDRGLFDLTQVDRVHPVQNSLEVKWEGNAASLESVDTSTRLTLTDTSLESANLSRALWQYTTVGNRAGWVSYPLPETAPPLRDTSPLAVGLNSAIEVEVELRDVADDARTRGWRLSLSPLLSLTDVGGNLLVRINEQTRNVRDKQTEADVSIRLFCNSENFDIGLQSPDLLAFREALVDPRDVPSTTSLVRSIRPARMNFRNSAKAAIAGQSPVRAVTAKILGGAISFVSEAPIRLFRHPGKAVLRAISPAGRNVLQISADPAIATVALPDAARGYIEYDFSTVIDNMPVWTLEIQFPRGSLIGALLPAVPPMSIPGSAIEPRHPWTEVSWDAVLLDAFTYDSTLLTHRNLILEVAEFFRRLREQMGNSDALPIHWTDSQIAVLARDRFAEAASWTHRQPTSTPVELKNFLPNARNLSNPLVTYIDNGDWPAAQVHTSGTADRDDHYLEVQRYGGARSEWLAYELADVQFGDTDEFPTFRLADRTGERNQDQFQQLVFGTSRDGTVISAFDNAGVTRKYGAMQSSNSIPLSLLPIFASGTEELFVLDFAGTLRASQRTGSHIAILCRGLVVMKTAEQGLTMTVKPVDPGRVAELGDLGDFRVRYPEPSAAPTVEPLRGRFQWPLIGHYPVVGCALERIELVNHGEGPEIQAVEFTAVLPSPREVAFVADADTEFTPPICKALSTTSALLCTIGQFSMRSPAAKVGAKLTDHQMSVSVTGEFLWEFPPERPSQIVDGSTVSSDGPNLLTGAAMYSESPVDETSLPWTLSNTSGNVRVLGTTMPTNSYGEIRSTWHNGNVTFRSAKFNLDSGFGIAASTHCKLVPEFRLVVDPDSDTTITLTCTKRSDRDGERKYDCGQVLTRQRRDWKLELVQDIYFGFIPVVAPKNAVLLLWREEQNGKRVLYFREWMEGNTEQTVCALRLEGFDILLRGPRQKFTVTTTAPTEDGSTSSTSGFFSAYLKSDQGLNSLRLLVQSQEFEVDRQISAQFTIGSPELEESKSLAGTLHLKVMENNGLQLDHHELYDVLPAKMMDSGRTETDVIIPAHQAEQRTVSRKSLDLRPLVSNLSADLFSQFATWRIRPRAQHSPVMSLTLPTSGPPSLLDSKGHLKDCPRRSPQIVFESTLPVAEMPAPAVVPEIISAEDEPVTTSSDQSFEDFPDLRSIALASSKHGQVFAATLGASGGYLISESSVPTWIAVTEPVRGACFMSELLIIATHSKMWKYENETLTELEIPGNIVPLTIQDAMIDPSATNRLVASGTVRNNQYIFLLKLEGPRLELESNRRTFGPANLISVGVSQQGTPIALISRMNGGWYLALLGSTSARFSAKSITAASSSEIRGRWMLNTADIAATFHQYRLTDKVETEDYDPETIPAMATSLGSTLWNGRHLTIVSFGRQIETQLRSGKEDKPAPLNKLTTLRPADAATFVVKDGELTALTVVVSGTGADGKLDIQAHRIFADPFLSSVDANQIPLDRCADGQLTRPPEDRALAVPQIWHAQADGAQLLASFRSDWKFIDIDNNVDSDELPESDWLIGPVIHTGERLQIIRTDLAISEPESEDLHLRTDTLFGLGRNQEIGVLYNQTSEITGGTQEQVIQRSMEALVTRRAWRGVTLWRTLDEDTPRFRFLSPPRESQRIRRTDVPAMANTSNSPLSQPDRRIIPIDQVSAPFPPASPRTEFFQPLPHPRPDEDPQHRSAVDINQDVRRLYVARASGELAEGYRVAELMLGEIAAFSKIGRRSVMPPSSEMAIDRVSLTTSVSSKQFLPQNFELVSGSGKSGAMISQRIQSYREQSVGNGYLTHSTVAAQRDPLRLARSQSATMRRVDAIAESLDAFPNHFRVQVDWDVSFMPLAIDRTDQSESSPLPLTVPQDNKFIEFVDEKYEIVDGNRRVFALVTLADGRLFERPEFVRNGDEIVRDTDADGTLPVVLRGSPDAETLEPQVYLITRVEAIDIATEVIGYPKRLFEPFVTCPGPDDTIISRRFAEVFRLVSHNEENGSSDGVQLWKAIAFQTNDVELTTIWSSGTKLTIEWKLIVDEREESVTIYPWSSDELTEPSEPLIVRQINEGESFSHLIVSDAGYRSLVLAFEVAAGDDVARSTNPSLQTEDDTIFLQISDAYKATTDVEIRNGLNNCYTQVVTSLPGGEVLGGQSPIHESHGADYLNQH